ncbi:MAG: carbamoyl-phosphate synthase large subunit [Actinomycetaceae bacterium]|nr:carbamoyl-phosphate synthase large subunit [Actinomycetaceae bacterium]
MPKRNDIKTVMVIGSGPIVIGQAAEFDYSGTQACRVLKDEGLRVVLVNSNPATIMTDPNVADATYVEPITTPVLTRIIAKERPDALLPTLGGQTALNAAIALDEAGVLAKYEVELIGANAQAINAGEDREEFKKVVERCGGEVARSFIAHSLDECHTAARDLGYPLVVRPSFTMGGLGSGVAYTPEDLDRIAGAGLQDSATHEVLLEESILGWKEIELEMMRDATGACVQICSIENFDPVGVHTGDSITLAPAQTLTDQELQDLRALGEAIISEVGIKAAGCNLQFALHPETGRVIVIEMNPRVSRSSALASKATGYPIAKIAAKLAIGYTLEEIPNDLAPSLTAAQDPEIDYVALKVPRFAFEKFPAAAPTLTTTMKSVGEVMSLGGTFAEALGKAMRSLDKNGAEFDWTTPVPDTQTVKDLLEAIKTPTEARLGQIMDLLRADVSVADIYQATMITPWFLEQLVQIRDAARQIFSASALGRQTLEEAKKAGLSDTQIAQIRRVSPETVRELRLAYGLHPTYRVVDTCAGKYPSTSTYMYSTYCHAKTICEGGASSGHGDAAGHEATGREAVIILGSGPNRIGQGVEFDYSCVHAALALADTFDTVMINCNPETVSTDYDISSRLYFEPLTFEDVMEVYRAQCARGPVKGMIVQLGGQTPLSLAAQLADAGVPILGTSPEAINAAEDREAFEAVYQAAGLQAPAHGTATTNAQALEVAQAIGFPVLVRPSYVLGGRGMEIIYDTAGLQTYLERLGPDTAEVGSGPLLVDKFLDRATEIDVDALFDGQELFLAGVMEHLEEAGIHSGDSACVLPPTTISDGQIARIRAATEAIARGVGVRGLINIQFALSSDVLYIIEANPRASRTVPFVAKATGVALAKAAALLMAGSSIADLRASRFLPEGDFASWPAALDVCVKEAVLPFKRFRTFWGQTVDSVLGPEMRSTGEVMGIGASLPLAFAKSQEAAYGGLPEGGTVLVSVADDDKRGIVLPCARLVELGFSIVATSGTAKVLARNGIPAHIIERDSENGRDRHVDDNGVETGREFSDFVRSPKVVMVVNMPGAKSSRVAGYRIRTAATSTDKPIITTVQALQAAVMAISAQVQHPDVVPVALQNR